METQTKIPAKTIQDHISYVVDAEGRTTSMRYVVWKDQKAVASDLRPIYQSVNLAGAEQKMEEFAEKWGGKYPLVVESWRRNWLRLTRFFEYPAAIRKVVYTTARAAPEHR